MDHDVMLRDVGNLKRFMSDFLAASGLTMDQFHAIADRRRKGERIDDMVPASRQDVIPSAPSAPADTTKEISDLSARLGALEAAKAESDKFADDIHLMLTWFQENHDALERLLAGSHAAAEVIEGNGAESASSAHTGA